MARLIRDRQVIPANLLTRFLNSPSSLLTHPHNLKKITSNPILRRNPSQSKQTVHSHSFDPPRPPRLSPQLAFFFPQPRLLSLLLPFFRVEDGARGFKEPWEVIEGLESPNDIVNAAKDLGNLVNSKGWDWPDVVIGHSMGGKVALQFAQSCANRDYGENVKLPKQLWVLDSVLEK